jgi:hypothetical protein
VILGFGFKISIKMIIRIAIILTIITTVPVFSNAESLFANQDTIVKTNPPFLGFTPSRLIVRVYLYVQEMWWITGRYISQLQKLT